MKYEQVNFLSAEQFRRLTGIKSTTFDKMVRILSEADNKKKAKGGRKNYIGLKKLDKIFTNIASDFNNSNTILVFSSQEKTFDCIFVIFS